MLLQGHIVRNLLIGMILFNAVLIGLAFYLAADQPWLPSALFPGRFGPGLSLDFMGNFVVLSFLLLINALVITAVGFKDTLHAIWAGMRLSPRTMRRFLNEKAGLAADISGIVAAAVQEEEKLELSYIDRANWVLRIGLILFALSLPALCVSLARAEAGGAPMFAVDQVPVANVNISNEEIWRFTGDQIAGALLLDIPEVFHLKASRLETNTGNFALAFLVLLYRTLIGFGVLLVFIATSRMRALWRFAMEVAMPVRDIVGLEPELAAGAEPYRHDDRHDSFQERRERERREEESRYHQPEPVIERHVVHEEEVRREPVVEHVREERYAPDRREPRRVHEEPTEYRHREQRDDYREVEHHAHDYRPVEHVEHVREEENHGHRGNGQAREYEEEVRDDPRAHDHTGRQHAGHHTGERHPDDRRHNNDDDRAA